MESAGVRIAVLRKLAGWTQQQLAVRTFVSTSLVKKIELGRTPPSSAFIAACAKAFGVDVRVLLAGERRVPGGLKGFARWMGLIRF